MRVILRFFVKHCGFVLGRTYYLMFALTSIVMLIDVASYFMHSMVLGILSTLGALPIIYYIRKKAKTHIFLLSMRVNNFLRKMIIRLRQKHYYNLIIQEYNELLTAGADFSDMNNKKVANFDRLTFYYIECGTYNYSDIAKIYMNSLIYGSGGISQTYGMAVLYSQLSTKRAKIDNYYNLIGDIFHYLINTNSMDKFISDVRLYMSYSFKKEVDVEDIKHNFYANLPAENQLGIMI